jgi:hypothetical protein
MKLFQRIVLALLAVGVLAAGVGLIALPFSEQAMGVAASYFEDTFWRMGAGIVLAAFALFALLPFGGMRAPTQITVPSPNGNIVIHLAPVESSMARTLGKLPIIKKADLRVVPTDENRRVRITARVALKKPAGASAVETTERLREYVDKLGRRILGATEVTTVELVVTNLIVDPTQTAESLNAMLKGLEEIPVEAVAVSVTGASASTAGGGLTEAKDAFESRMPPESASDVHLKPERSGELLDYEQYRRESVERVETPEVLEPEESQYTPVEQESVSERDEVDRVNADEVVPTGESNFDEESDARRTEDNRGQTSSAPDSRL